MIKRLLNKNNLIIAIITLVICMLIIPNIVLAADLQLSDYLKEMISAWYVFIKYFCIAIMFVLFISLGIKAAISSSPDSKADFKKMLVYWLIGLIILFMLEDIIYAIIALEQNIVERLRQVGLAIAGDSTPGQEISLYESARTKAYEIKFSSGMLGLFMYIILVYYTFKLFIIYFKRYINVMLLILVAPIVIVMYTYRRIFQGKGGIIGRWIKEFIYNVFIQVVHAGVYSTIIAFSLSMSDNALSFLGAILAFIAFYFMFKLDAIIRKIFNFIGGSSTIEVRDYASLIKHPIQSFQDAKGYVTETLPQEIQNKAENLVENLTPQNIANRTAKIANSFAYEAKETMEAIDGKQVKVSAEAVRKEQEKIDNPNAIQKVFNTIQGIALGAASAAITGVENLSKKLKEQIKKINESTKKARQELNQDFEMIKRFAKILKYHAKRKIIEEKAEDEEQPVEEKLQATVINVLDTPEAEVLELKETIQESYDDMVAIVYETQGPAVFIYPQIGSTYMGLSVLASAKQEQRAAIGVSNIKNRTIAFPRKQLAKSVAEKEQEKGKVVSIEAARKKYKFKRFNSTSVQTITSSLNRRFIMNNEYLSNIYQAGQMVANGNIMVSGSYMPKGYSGVKKTTIKYTAKLKSHNEHNVTADITFGRYSAPDVKEEQLEEQNGKIIMFSTIQERKRQAQGIVQTYKDRVQDSNWAVLDAAATDVREVHNQRVSRSVQEVSDKTSTEIVLQRLTDMGQAVKINSELYVTLFDKPIEKVVDEIEGKDSDNTTSQIIADSTIIDIAIRYDIPLEQIDLREDQDIQDSILDELAKKGVISYTTKTNEEERNQVILALEERKNKILNEQKESYISSVIKKTAAKIFVDAIDTGDKIADKAKNVGNRAYEAAMNNSLINNKFNRLLTQVAKNAVEVEAERVKQELLNQVQAAVDTTKEYAKTAQEVYGISKDDFKRKGEQIKEGTKDFAEKVGETAENAAKAVVDAAVEPFRIGRRKGKRNNDEYESDDMFIFYIMGAVVSEGRYELPIGSRVYDAIKIAGGPTEEADLTAIPYYDPIRDGETIYIPRRSNEDIEKTLEKCRPVVEEVIKNYLVENNISNVEALRKLVHKKTILSKIQRALSNENITTSQIEGLIEKRIKELKYIRDGLNNARKEMKVVDKAETVVQETKSISEDRRRQETGARNAQEDSLDEALRKLHSLSDSGKPDESDDEQVEEQNQDTLMNELLSQLEEQREKVLVSARSSRAAQNVNRLEFDENPGKRRAREEFTKDPDEMMNKILGRF